MEKTEEPLTNEELDMLIQKLSTMDIRDFTSDMRITQVFERYKRETGGSLWDFFTEEEIRAKRPNWGQATEDRYIREFYTLCDNVREHLSTPTELEANSPLPLLREPVVSLLRKATITDITHDRRIARLYDESRALSLFAFTYWVNRNELRDWGRRCENQFLEALNQYLEKNLGDGFQATIFKIGKSLDQDFANFLKLDAEPLLNIYSNNFNEIQESIRKNNREDTLVAQIAAEIPVKWPYSYRARLLKEFLFETPLELSKIRALGVKKVRSIILCLIWAAKGGARNMGKFSDMSPHELLAASPLNFNEKEALTLRFLGDVPRTLEDAGRIMNVTRERVRQHQKTAEIKLRTLGINQFARDWLRRNSFKIWAMLSDDDGETVDSNSLKGGVRKCVPGEVLLATVLAGWSLDDVLSLEGDPIDDWWVKKAKA